MPFYKKEQNQGEYTPEKTKLQMELERKIININGTQYNARHLEQKSLLPDVNMYYDGYYDFDLKEHGALYGFLYVERVEDGASAMTYHNVLIDPGGHIVGTDVAVDTLKAKALQHIASTAT